MNKLPFGDVPAINWSVGALVLAVIVVAGILFIGKRRQGWKPAAARQVSAVPDQVDVGDRAERRRTARRFVTPVFVLLRNHQLQSQDLEGLLLNVTSGGVGISLTQAVEVGTVFDIRIADVAASVPWVPVEVRYCVAASCRWRIGCRYLKPLPAEAKLSFS